jgi:HEAT repeat protein
MTGIPRPSPSKEYALTTDSTARFQKLIRGLKSPYDLKRIHAGLLLGRMGQKAREAVPTLLELLQDESIQNRKLAAWTLGNIGQGTVEAVPALLVTVRDSNEGVRTMAREALEKISPSGTPARAA